MMSLLPGGGASMGWRWDGGLLLLVVCWILSSLPGGPQWDGVGMEVAAVGGMADGNFLYHGGPRTSSGKRFIEVTTMITSRQSEHGGRARGSVVMKKMNVYKLFYKNATPKE